MFASDRYTGSSALAYVLAVVLTGVSVGLYVDSKRTEMAHAAVLESHVAVVNGLVSDMKAMHENHTKRVAELNTKLRNSEVAGERWQAQMEDANRGYDDMRDQLARCQASAVEFSDQIPAFGPSTRERYR